MITAEGFVIFRRMAASLMLSAGFFVVLYIALIAPRGDKLNKPMMDLAMRCLDFGAGVAVSVKVVGARKEALAAAGWMLKFLTTLLAAPVNVIR